MILSMLYNTDIIGDMCNVKMDIKTSLPLYKCSLYFTIVFIQFDKSKILCSQLLLLHSEADNSNIFSIKYIKSEAFFFIILIYLCIIHYN